MASVTASLGVGSGLDLNAILKKLKTVEEQKLTVISDKQDYYTAKAKGYATLSSALEAFSTATAALTDADLYSSKTASENTSFTTSVTSSATAGSYSVYVTQLAQAQSLVSASQSSKSTALSSDASTLSITVDGTTKDISLTADQTSLTGLVSAINASGAGVTASIIQSGDSSYQLVVTSSETGAANTISISSTDSTLEGIIGTSAMTEAVEAQDAIVSVNGITVTRSSNTISDVPSTGVTLTLTAESTAKETLKISASNDDMTTAINAWVDAYNTLLDTFSSLTAYTDDGDDTDDGALLGDLLVRGVKNKLQSLLGTAQSDDNYQVITQLGISINGTTGKLAVDSSALATALSDNPDSVKAFFVGDGSTTGLATQLVSSISTYTDERKGFIAAAQDSITEIQDKLATKYNAVSARIDATIARYTTQFTALDTLVAQLDNTSTYLTNAFDQLNRD